MKLREHPVAKARLVARLAETWFHRLPSPNRLVIDVTRRCNLRCEMCQTWTRPNEGELSAQEIGELVSDLPRLVWLDLTGGEPFIRSDIAAVFRAVCDGAPSLSVLHFQTNGWLQDRVVDVCDEITARRPDLDLVVTVSLDGPRELHDKIRGRAGSYDRALRTLAHLAGRDDLQVFAGTTVTSSNAESLDALGHELRAHVPGFHPRMWHYNWLQRSEHFFGNASGDDDLAASPPRDLVFNHLRRRGRPQDLIDLMELAFLVNLDGYARGEKAGMSCQALRSTAFISPEGDVYPCHVYDRVLGNVRTRPLTEIWHDAATLAARDDIVNLACGGCFTPCEAYPALAGAPVATAWHTARRGLGLLARAALSRP